MAIADRQKEEKRLKQLKHPKENNSEEIGRLIKETVKKKHTVWLSSDWHLFIRITKGHTETKRRSNFATIIENIKKHVKPDDLLIFLGDLVDGESQDKEALQSILLCLPGKKVMVRGNNDLFLYSFYKSCGFAYVVDSFVWNDILFTHMPVENDNKMNIHAHIHGYKTYWIPYTNQIDVYSKDGTPRRLQDVIDDQPAYAKSVKEVPEKFEQESVTIFELEMARQAYFNGEDPYPVE
jgi:calcineurin-like phosphoesterase family protein